MEHSFFEDFGVLSAKGESETYSATIEGALDLNSNWRMQVSGSWGRNRDYTFSHRISRTELAAALASSDPNTALNPFGPGTNPAVIEAIFSDQFAPGGTNRMIGGDVRADGSLFELPAGTVGVALGSEFRKYTLATDTTIGPIANPATDYNRNEREVVSAYAELLVPLVGGGNALPGIERLDLSLAARYDDYNDFGNTSNPKVGVTWEPFEGLSIRGSYGTSFRAPALSDIRAPGESNVVGTATDPLSPTGRSEGLTIRGGNPDLKPEEAETYTLGFAWTPVSFPDLSVDLSYFSIDYEQQIGSAWGAPVLQEDEIYADFLIRNPTDEQIQAVLNNGRPLSGGLLPATFDYIIDARTVNRGATSARGVDFQLGYDWPTESRGTFSLMANGTYFSRYDTQLTSTAPMLARAGTINYPLRFRSRVTLRWSLDNITAGLMLNYFDSYKDTREDPVDSIDAFTGIDGTASYAFGSSGFSVSLNISNLFDEAPPFINSTSGYDPGNASPYGRMVMLGVTKTFQ
ncbi:MAG TPA: TonB-dependent receptor [Pseudomonadaceae bacterium]|nr:TonB-dependent receptor [Pseudomonadaceae bacterium]